MPPVFVTGASGFIGGAVVDELCRRELPVVAVTRSASRTWDGVEWVRVGSYDELDAPSGATCVHLAGARDTAAEDLAVEAAVGDLEYLTRAFARVVYVSSASVYGDSARTPRREDDPTQADTPYRELKLRLERVALGTGHVVVRPANVYGAGMAPTSVVTEIAAQIGAVGPLIVRDAEAVRDFVHVRDVGAGLVDVASSGDVALAGTVLNVGTGVGTSIGALARLLLRLGGEPDRPVIATSSAPHPSHLVVDPGRMLTLVGWVAGTDLTEGLREVLEGCR